MKRIKPLMISTILAALLSLNAHASDPIDLVQSAVSFSEPGTYTVCGYGVQTVNTLSVSGSGDYAITIDRVNISEDNPISITNGANVRLTLSGENTLHSTDSPGIFLDKTSSLTIDGSGSLTIAPGGANPGIGSSNCGSVTIAGGTIEIIGSGRGSSYSISGIGGSTCESIAVSSGSITVTNSAGRPAIGESFDKVLPISISGGTVNVTGDPAIVAEQISISGGIVLAESATTAIQGDTSVQITSGSVTASGKYGITAQTISISGGTVTASGTPALGFLCTNYSSVSSVSISGGVVTATGKDFVIGAVAPVSATSGISSNVEITGGTVNVFTDAGLAKATTGGSGLIRCAVGAAYFERNVSHSRILVKNASILMSNACEDFYGSFDAASGTPRRYSVKGLTAPYEVSFGNTSFTIPAAHATDPDYLHLYLDKDVTDITINGQTRAPSTESTFPAGDQDIILYAPGTYVLNGNSDQTSGRILIKGTGDVDVTLNQVNISVADAALVLCDKQQLTLRLCGDNTLASTFRDQSNYVYDCRPAVLITDKSSTISIYGPGALTVSAVGDSAITAEQNAVGGSLMVESGTLSVQSRYGYSLRVKTVTMNGGELQASGIGGEDAVTVNVCGGTLRGSIGGDHTADVIHISGGTVVADNGLGTDKSTVTITAGNVTAENGICGSRVSISGGVVTATSPRRSGIEAAQIQLTGGTITAVANYTNGYGYNYGIEADTILIKNCSVYAAGSAAPLSTAPLGDGYVEVFLNTFCIEGLTAPYTISAGSTSFTVPASHPDDSNLYLYLPLDTNVSINGRHYEVCFTDGAEPFYTVGDRTSCTLQMDLPADLSENCMLIAACYNTDGKMLTCAYFDVPATGSASFSADLDIVDGTSRIRAFLLNGDSQPLYFATTS